MRIGILITNTDRSEFADGQKGDGDKFRDLLVPLRPAWDLPEYDLTREEFPDGLAFDGFIIGGSPASVHDPDAWIPRAQSLIRDAHAAGLKLFGACFGHQAIALALGGLVGRNPDGWVLGTVETVLEDAPIRAYAAHSEQVTVLPPGMTVLGTTPGCPVAAYGGPGVFCTQYHPEMTHGFITALVEEVAAKLPPRVTERARESLALHADRDAMAERIVRFFET